MSLYLTKHFSSPESIGLKGYRSNGGYEAASKALKEMTPAEILNEVKRSELRGRGGAGFPTGLKWTFMPGSSDQPTFIACNCDESEPGTFKDRQILEHEPHRLIEGLIISAYAMGVKTCYIYIRGEYIQPHRKLVRAIEEAYQAGFLGTDILGSGFDLNIYVHRGAGAYICGEETGLMESVEGKRGHPRKKPPFPAGYGLWGYPTTINNVETFCNVPAIITNGSDWFQSLGTESSSGNAIFCVSGHVNKPGSYELPMGFNLKSLIFELAGGIRNGNRLKAVIPGGTSTKILPASLVDVKMDHESLNEVGSSLGTGAVIVMDHTTCMVRVGTVISQFYRHETCGQCSICREGTAWLHQTLARIEKGAGQPDDISRMLEIAASMEGTTICALSDAAAWPIQGLIRHFRDEFEEHIALGKCRFSESFTC